MTQCEFCDRDATHKVPFGANSRWSWVKLCPTHREAQDWTNVQEI